MQPIIKNRRVRLVTQPVACSQQKRVQLLEDEGVIRAIELTCSCGEVTVIELEYNDRESSNGEAQS